MLLWVLHCCLTLLPRLSIVSHLHCVRRECLRVLWAGIQRSRYGFPPETCGNDVYRVILQHPCHYYHVNLTTASRFVGLSGFNPLAIAR